MKRKINILHVEDSEAIVDLMKLYLLSNKNVASIESAGDLKSAKEIMNKKKTDAVVLDIKLPDGNGIELLKWIKEKHPHTPVLMLSNHADESHREYAKKSGADYFFDKSTEFENVSKALTTLGHL